MTHFLFAELLQHNLPIADEMVALSALAEVRHDSSGLSDFSALG
jgi:hypothetical protein